MSFLFIAPLISPQIHVAFSFFRTRALRLKGIWVLYLYLQYLIYLAHSTINVCWLNNNNIPEAYDLEFPAIKTNLYEAFRF